MATERAKGKSQVDSWTLKNNGLGEVNRIQMLHKACLSFNLIFTGNCNQFPLKYHIYSFKNYLSCIASETAFVKVLSKVTSLWGQEGPVPAEQKPLMAAYHDVQRRVSRRRLHTLCLSWLAESLEDVLQQWK